jgi:hypothetical protein
MQKPLLFSPILLYHYSVMVNSSARCNTVGVGPGGLTIGTVMRVVFLLLFFKVYGKLITGTCNGEHIETGMDSS